MTDIDEMFRIAREIAHALVKAGLLRDSAFTAASRLILEQMVARKIIL